LHVETIMIVPEDYTCGICHQPEGKWKIDTERMPFRAWQQMNDPGHPAQVIICPVCLQDHERYFYSIRGKSQSLVFKESHDS
jgi:hypothetical protein